MIPPELLNRVTLGDSRMLCGMLPAGSIDIIFTDPPYPGEFLPLYEWLANEAPRLLKPDGWLLVYCGVFHKDTIMNYMRKTLDYFWDFAAMNRNGPGPLIWNRKIISKYKSILAYRQKGSAALPKTNVLSVHNGTEHDKRYHVWQQDESTARYYIDCFTRSGDVVLDPFCGGGTTPYVCGMLGLDWISFELDQEAFDSTNKRLSVAVQPVLFRGNGNGQDMFASKED